MVRRLLLLVILGVMTSGCFVAPLALIGPATSGFTTASLAKSGITSGIDFVIKKRTGKSGPVTLKNGHYPKQIGHNLAKQALDP